MKADEVVPRSGEVVTRSEAIARGLRYYWTGRPCIYGHVALRPVRTKKCAECSRIRARAWAAANVEANRARASAWVPPNPAATREKRRAYESARRARRAASGGTYTPDDITLIFAKQRGKCAYCFIPMKKGYHVDHVTPISKGGTNSATNLALACAPCNYRKSAMPAEVFARRLGRLL